jgi:hypothetical protein
MEGLCMSQKKHSLEHDILIVALLLGIIWIVVGRVRKYVHLNKSSLIHELEASFTDTIHTVQQHIGIARQAIFNMGMTDPHTKLMRDIRALTAQLHTVEEKYTRNAPTLALLGPLGTTSIVLKEQELRNKLQYIALGINDIFSELLNKSKLVRPERNSITLDELITTNGHYARELRRGMYSYAAD